MAVRKRWCGCKRLFKNRRFWHRVRPVVSGFHGDAGLAGLLKVVGMGV